MRWLVASLLLCPTLAAAQAADSARVAPPPPPATKLEAFRPAAGSVSTLGYEELGALRGVSIDVRERRSGARAVRGVLVEVKQIIGADGFGGYRYMSFAEAGLT